MTAEYVVEQHPILGAQCTAVFDGSHTYRYALTRRWGTGPGLVFVMCNPSIVDAHRDDPTIRRCLDFARRDGFAALTVLNLFGLRSSYPEVLGEHDDPVGPLNDQTLRERTAAAPAVVAAWGVHGALGDRDRTVLRMLTGGGITVLCLGVTEDHFPCHPLYVPARTPLRPYAPASTEVSR